MTLEQYQIEKKSYDEVIKMFKARKRALNNRYIEANSEFKLNDLVEIVCTQITSGRPISIFGRIKKIKIGSKRDKGVRGYYNGFIYWCNRYDKALNPINLRVQIPPLTQILEMKKIVEIK